MRILSRALILYGFLSLMDWACTMWGIGIGLHEGNHLVAQIIATGGWSLFLLGKIASIVLIGVATVGIYQLGEKCGRNLGLYPALTGIGLVTIGQAGVVVRNLLILAR